MQILHLKLCKVWESLEIFDEDLENEFSGFSRDSGESNVSGETGESGDSDESGKGVSRQ